MGDSRAARGGFRPRPAHARVSVRLAILILVAFTGVAAAQEPPAPPPAPPPTEPRPWAEGVSDAEQQVALAAFEAGNAEYAESRFAQALARYREAIAHWDHPAIRFNMAVCLINLGQPIEARQAIERALAFGPAPLDPGVHQQALTYRTLLDGQLTHVTIRSDERGAEVTLDGTLLFTAPGSSTMWLLPGKHQVVATKPGFLTYSETLALGSGTTETFDVRLMPLTSTTRTTRRWQPWKPYAVAGAGVLVAGLGGIAYALAARDYDRYDEEIREACPRGCNAEQAAMLGDVRAIEDRADVEQNIARAMFAVGGALALTGGVGLYLNQRRTEVIAPMETPTIVPRPGGAIVTLGLAF
jgi:tetratricopeptide (TPR) repeat protein